MGHLQDELPEVGEVAHAVVRAAQDAGVWISGGGVQRQQASIVDTDGTVTDGTVTDGTVTDGPDPETKAIIVGFVIIGVPSRQEALD